MADAGVEKLCGFELILRHFLRCRKGSERNNSGAKKHDDWIWGKAEQFAVRHPEIEVGRRFIPHDTDMVVLKTTAAIKQRLWRTWQVANVPAPS